MRVPTDEILKGVFSLGIATLIFVLYLVLVALSLWMWEHLDFHPVPNDNFVQFQAFFQPQLFWAGDGEQIHSLEESICLKHNCFTYSIMH